jgi:hypothetical protein
MFDSEGVEFGLDDRRRAFFFEPEFGMAMDVAANGDRTFGDFGKRIDDEHACGFEMGRSSLAARANHGELEMRCRC